MAESNIIINIEDNASLIEWLESRINSCNNTAGELIQEYDDDYNANGYLEMAKAFQEVIDHLKENEWR